MVVVPVEALVMMMVNKDMVMMVVLSKTLVKMMQLAEALVKMSHLSPVVKQLVAWAAGQFRTGSLRAPTLALVMYHPLYSAVLGALKCNLRIGRVEISTQTHKPSRRPLTQ